MMSIQTIYAQKTIGITDLKRGDTSFINNLTEPVAVLKRDSLEFEAKAKKHGRYYIFLLSHMVIY